MGELLLVLCLTTLMSTVYSSQNNIPRFSTNKTLDCTLIHGAHDICHLTLVIEPLQSMTYYDITDTKNTLRGYRATFDSNGTLVTLRPNDPIEGLQPPIITDGHFRPIITVNGQMPGPTIIAHENQVLNITVYNELTSIQGISIHWHGMHQRRSQGADGVAYITQLPIMTGQHMDYTFRAFPSGTHWYHAHSGAQRTDGLYGALIVKDTLTEAGSLYDHDLPDQHTLILQDWQRDASIDLFYIIGASLRYWKEPLPKDPPYTGYSGTRTVDNTAVGPQPFWSAIINDKGRHYDENGNTNIKHTSLNFFNCSRGKQYRFRLIGAQGLYAFKFSIEGHRLTVVASDGFQIKSIRNVDYIIINTGERYDVIVKCNQKPRDYWIWAETLEDERFSGQKGFYNPISKHRAEAVLHYTSSTATTMSDISSTKKCTPRFKCRAVNCPFIQYSNVMNCINSHQFKPLEKVLSSVMGVPKKTLFYSFGFDGEISTLGSSVDGINFRFPAQPPLTNYKEFQKDICIKRGCDHDNHPHCACTQVLDISELNYGDVVEIVMINRNNDPTGLRGTSHPIHLHGHTFYVHDVGYPMYNFSVQFQKANDDIECVLEDGSPCPTYFITVEGNGGKMKQTVRYTNNQRPRPNGYYARKDTVIVPFGGYTTIRFKFDNPGWWFFHCHIEIHQLQGMAAVVKELQTHKDEKYVNHSQQHNDHIQPHQL